jgi:hypothetical protein
MKMKIRIEIAQAYGVPLSTLLIYLKSQDSVDQHAQQQSDISKWRRVHRTNHSDMKN